MDSSDEDYFSDGGFDDSTLLQLEQNALQATQAQRAQHVQVEAAQPVQKQTSGLPRADANPAAADQSLYHSQPPQLHRGVSGEYRDVGAGELDAEVVDNGNGPVPAVEKRTTFAKGFNHHEDHHMQELRPLGYSARLQKGGWQQPQTPTEQQMSTGEGHVIDNKGVVPQQQATSGELEELRVRIEELTRQNELMRQELAAAKSDVQTKAGEIAILRSNQAKAAQDLDRQIAALQKRRAEEAERHKQEIQAAYARSERLETENAFLKRDLAEESQKVNNLKAKKKSEQQKGQPVTPKKTKVLPFRDGFDDDEIAVVSPTKTPGGRSKRGTPTVPGKRKRKPSQDRPVPMAPLQLGPSQNIPLEETSASDDPMIGVEYQHTNSRKEDQNLRFIKWILNHRTPPNKERDLEVMTKLAFPSEPGRTFSSIVLDETSTLRSSNYPVGYAHSIISLWSRALKEQFFKPVYMFMAIIKFILLLDTTTIAPALIERLVPVLQESGNVNGVVRFHHSPVSRQNFGQVKQTPRSELHQEVDSTEALRILYLVATGCMDDENAMKTFWKHIDYNFILMMLNSSQLMDDITINLNLLTTSIRQDSFGPIQETEKDQESIENYIIDRAANLLSEKLQVDEGQDSYTPAQICNFRLEVLSFLTAVAFSAPNPANSHGSSVIAAHPTVLARLIRSMHDELDALYSYPPEHELHSALVNGLMRLIYGVTRKHRDIDLHAKLGHVAGGKQKYLVVLTRLAFSEGQLLEAGITDETVDMAHEMLEDAVNPDEAEALLEAFPNAKRDESYVEQEASEHEAS